MTTCSRGTKGRFKASGREYEITDTTSTTSTIKFRGEQQTYEIDDVVLKADTVKIEKWDEH